MNSKQGRDAQALYEMRKQQGDRVSAAGWLFAAVMGLLGCGACAAILYFIFGGW